MVSKTHSLRLPADLYEIMQLRWKALGYRNISDYHRGLVRYDAMVQGPHSVTLPMSQLPDGEQDDIDSQLLEVTRRGVGERGQLLERIIERAKAAGEPIEAASVPKVIVRKKSPKGSK